MPRMLPSIAIGLALMVACAVVQGKFTERWTAVQSDVLDHWVDQLKKMPRRVGDWEGTRMPDSSDEVKAIAKFAGESNMAYTNRRTGEVVCVALMCGLGRNVSKHIPENCMPAQGYELAEQTVNYKVDCGSEKPEFATAMFAKESPERTDRQRILWTWNDGAGWRAPKWPKVTYARTPAMYKLYLFNSLRHLTDKIQDSPSTRFAEEFIPALEEALFPSKANAQGEATPAGDNQPVGNVNSQ